MDGARALNSGEVPCERCGAPPGDLPPVQTSLFDGPLWRCDHCGLRTIEQAGARVQISTCRRCGLAYTISESGGTGRCGDCRAQLLPEDLPREELAEASERDLRAALSTSFSFVALPQKTDYLTRVARAVSAAIPADAPAPGTPVRHAARRPVVAVFRDPAVRTLALPSGTILVSTGCLASLKDEAELAFVLGHELAHAAGGDAAIGLIRIGLRTVAVPEAGDTDGWTRAAENLMRLGYGSEIEHAADLTALRALVRIGYEAGAPSAYLGRLQRRVSRGDADVADLAVAHPPAADRRGRLEAYLRQECRAEGPGRTNRELFRRAAGPAVLASRLRPIACGLADDDGDVQSREGFRRTVLFTVLGIALLATLFLVLGFLFAR